MVKGSGKAIKSTGNSLVLECKNEELSDCQILYRKKQLEDIYLLQGALQGNQGATQIDFGMGTTQPVMNGGNVFPIRNDALGVPKQYGGLNSLSRTGVVNGLNSTPGPKSRRNASAADKAGKSKSKASTPQPTQSLTQALRATRKAAGPLPPPKINMNNENEPEIEVLQEMRNNVPVPRTQMPSNAATNLAAQLGVNLNKSVLPKQGSNLTRILPKVVANNTLLLNINIRPRNLAPVSVNTPKRKEMDGKVKVVLMKTPSEFVEWLLRQGLIRSQQFCNTHKTNRTQPTKLKLGMFSDPKVLTSSGGYVWIGECCGRKYISVYSGSLFGSTPIDKVPPTSVLKLIYHWSCQTSISNVETWVKVEKPFISKIYHYLKCICSVILHDKIYDLGVNGTEVELGIVSLGTTTADGSKKAVKVEILGLYCRQTKAYRLFASTPEPASNSRERFLRILKPVKEVVHKTGRIICDQSVDPTCLHSMGFSNVDVCYSSENENDPKTNSIIMFYLRKHVPKMFQAALSQLTEHQVQLTLDELCWREKFAATSADCYDNVMENISYITFRELENPGVLPLLEFVAEYPHKNFRYKTQTSVKNVPAVPASVILAPTSMPLNVVPSQYNGNKCLVMSNKVMTKTGGELPMEVEQQLRVPPITIKNLSSITAGNFKQQTLSPADVLSKITNSALGNLTKTGDYKDLEPYFYGKIEGNALLGKELDTYNFKCHMCSETFEDNILFYSHLKYHFEGQLVEREKLDLMCPYCTSSFASVNALNKHKIDVHLMSDLTQVWCRICSEKFQNESMLKSHMMRKHVEAELPYRCEVCHFATSFYYEIINHFSRSHKGTPYVQCHYCLSVKTLTPNGAASFSARIFQHLQKHSQKINCKSCVLVFYSKYLLNEHKKEHLSCSGVNGVTRYESPNGYRILQFKPNIRSMPIGPSSSVVQTKNQAALSIIQCETPHLRLNLTYEQMDYKCIECDTPTVSNNHFNNYRKCSKCPYYTCCQNMIMKHSQVFHPAGSKKPLPYFIGSPIIMDDPLYCICGLSTRSGHHMANHLATCKKKTAYALPSPEASGPSEAVSGELTGEFMPGEIPAVDETVYDDMNNDQDIMMDVDDEDMPMMPLSVEIQEE